MAPIGLWRYEALIPGNAVRPGMRYSIEATDAANRVATCPAQPEDSIAVIVTNDGAPPVIRHSAIQAAPAGMPLTVKVTAKDPSGVQWVRLRYRSVTQVEDYRTLEMLPSGRPDEYVAEVPGEHVDPGWDFMYLIEAMDAAGNGAIYPDLEAETPYIVVRLNR